MPSSIADVVQFLLSPAASFVTGETVIAGGVPRPGNPMAQTRAWSEGYRIGEQEN